VLTVPSRPSSSANADDVMRPLASRIRSPRPRLDSSAQSVES
jgi:hypothetical protein